MSRRRAERGFEWELRRLGSLYAGCPEGPIPAEVVRVLDKELESWWRARVVT